MTDLLGFTNTELIVTDGTAGAGGSASDLPTVGSVYDAFNLGNGIENVYTAIPGTAGGSDTVTDTLVTPFGNVNLDSLFGNIDAAAPLQPGDAFTGLETADISGAPDAFTIGSTTFDPTLTGGAEGFTPVDQLVGAPPRCWRSAAAHRTSSAPRSDSRRRTSTSTTAPERAPPGSEALPLTRM